MPSNIVTRSWPLESKTPFIIHGLGRSRTAWMSTLLSYGQWKCYHEIALVLRSIQDIRDLFSQPNIGTAETGAIMAWPLIRHECPHVRTVVIRRNVNEAAHAMAETYRREKIPFDESKLYSIFKRADHSLDRIEAIPGALSLPYEALKTEEGCRVLFEFCLPYEFDRAWWLMLRDRVIEADLRTVVSYYQENYAAVENFKKVCKAELFRLARAGEISHAIH